MLPDTSPHTNLFFLKQSIHKNLAINFLSLNSNVHTLNRPRYLHIEIHRKLLHHVCYNKLHHKV